MGKRIVNYLKYVFDAVISIIYYNDEKCAVCKKEIYDDENICKECLNKVKFCDSRYFIEKNDISFEVYCTAYYSSVIREMIIKLKYRKDFLCGEVLAELMHKVLIEKNIQFDEIVFVPMTTHDLKKRGFNQSEFLASKLSSRVDKPLKNYIRKNLQTKDQIGLTDEMRWDNLKRSFSFYGPEKIKDKVVLLIHDVFTTGATAFFCSKELINNGAKKVIVLTVAKSSI
ncbi:ComF family protein [Clostridium acetobutylicum]|uniref:Predicted amidophosphoribosyltransferase, ComFC B.suntilis ortholog n=1 Tax=Clostridium acetobutylicum (strain ATCC 824 / DSM 792 / JCM 1419 / IAM 19013 / LMG 5710 / NBRC 13948 / NRRL B-527 / VKM B-1787 / 2291 / W) TaxID=272562 RepID=Q97F89_CLOAB|nr:ComF family protein [Clostridium acetobutylicum]AAK80795.1 Predicted amidophosphoribosyltransferase, ComFC B.suntilis ortholog [Clostridium acetobutylicum ATCC 824]